LEAILQKNTKNSPIILLNLLQELLQRDYCINGPVLTILGIFDRLITDKVMSVYSEVVRSGYELAGMMVPNWLRL